MLLSAANKKCRALIWAFRELKCFIRDLCVPTKRT